MARKSTDCRDFPDQTGCTLYLSEEEEVVRVAAQQAVSVHDQTLPSYRNGFAGT